MRMSIKLSDEQAEYCHGISKTISGGLRKTVNFHKEFYPLVNSLMVAKNALEAGVLNIGEYTAVVSRATNEYFNKIDSDEQVTVNNDV